MQDLAPNPSCALLPAQKLTALRRSIAQLEGASCALDGLMPLGSPEADGCLRGGLERSALHEVYAAREVDGAAASGFALALAVRALGERAPLIWIRPDLAAFEWGEVFVPGLAEWGLNPNRCVIVKVGHTNDALKAAFEALHCSALGAVIVESAGTFAAYDLTASRRLALAAGHSGVSAIALRLGAKPKPSAAATRWLVGTAPSHCKLLGHLGHPAFDAALIRNRKGRGGRWIMEWDSDAYLFRTVRTEPLAAAAHSRALPAAAHDRPHQAPAHSFRQAG